MDDWSVLGQADTASAVSTQPLASTTAAHINCPAKLSSHSVTQQHQRTLAKIPAASLPRQAPRAPMAAGRISVPAVTAVFGVSAAPAEPAGTGLTPLESVTALYMLNLLAKYSSADPFRAPVDPEAQVRIESLVATAAPVMCAAESTKQDVAARQHELPAIAANPGRWHFEALYTTTLLHKRCNWQGSSVR
jgi:hypothetical protein